MTTPTLQADALTFTYPGMTTPVLRGIEVSVAAGEMVAVRGRSGSGKSTLLYLLGLFIAPDDGRIVLLGEETTRMGDAARSRLRAHRIGFVFQDSAMHLDQTIEENVAEGVLYTGLSYAECLLRTRRLLGDFGIASFANRRPTQVSGGQSQRAALCRALVREPKLILADEPTGNLDPENSDIVIAGLRLAADAGAGVVIVTHTPGVADRCDRTIELA